MRTLNEIDAEIAQVKSDLANVKGGETEVYARIVGYYRSVRNWNRGKRAEFDERKMFSQPAGCGDCVQKVEKRPEAAAVLPKPLSARRSDDLNIAYYEFFSRKTCPNCPPVRDYMASLDMAGSSIDVDSDEGFARASEIGVLSAPTVVFFDANGVEVARASSAAALRDLFPREELRAAS